MLTFSYKQCTYKLTQGGVRAIVAVEEQKVLHILSVRW